MCDAEAFSTFLFLLIALFLCANPLGFQSPLWDLLPSPGRHLPNPSPRQRGYCHWAGGRHRGTPYYQGMTGQFLPCD